VFRKTSLDGERILQVFTMRLRDIHTIELEQTQ